jgi:hypothetical protein
MQYKELPTWAKDSSDEDSGKSMRMVDMSNDSEKEPETATPVSVSKFPYGLSISLTEKELEKLGLDNDVEAGDYLHCVMMAKVTSVHHHHSDTEDGVDSGCRVEMQIVAMSVEDESTEYEDEETDEE